MARISRVLVSRMLGATSIPTYTHGSTSYRHVSSTQSRSTSYRPSDGSLLSGISTQARSTSYRPSVYRSVLSGTSTQTRSYTPGPLTVTSIPTTISIPFPTEPSISYPSRCDFIPCPHERPEIFDKIHDESLNAICCYTPDASVCDSNHAFIIINKLLEQYPHVQAFHCLIPYSDLTNQDYYPAMDALNVSSLPMFHFYRNGMKEVDLDGRHIIRFKKVLKKLYKPAITSDHNRGSNQTSSGDLTFNQFQTRPFSTSVHTPESNQQSSGDLAFQKIQGRSSFELIVSEEYNLDVNRIQDKNMPDDAVLCFATYLEDSSFFVYALLYEKFRERFPHVPIYYVLLSPEEDGYKTTLESLNICPLVNVPTVRFFKNGKMVIEVACPIYSSDGYYEYMEETFQKLYNTEHTTTQELQPTRSKDKEVLGQPGKIVKELDCSLALEDIIGDVGIVHTPNEDLFIKQQTILRRFQRDFNHQRQKLKFKLAIEGHRDLGHKLARS